LEEINEENMKQQTLWGSTFLFIFSVFMAGYLIHKITPSQDINLIGVPMFLTIYGWLICNLYTSLLKHRMSFEKYKTGILIVVAIPAFISFLGSRTESVNPWSFLLLFFFLYSSAVLNLLGNNLLKTEN
jgi:hypothetical protein